MATSRKMMIMGALAMVLMSWTSIAQAQTPPSMSCIQALIPCSAALNSTGTPPATCCDPLRQAFETQLSCLCSVFQNTELAAAANFNFTQAMELPTRCGLSADPSVCTTGEAASPAPAPVAGGPTTSSPGPASTPTSTPGSNGGSSIAWTGSVSSLMFILAALIY